MFLPSHVFTRVDHQGADIHISSPKGDQLNLDCGTTESSAFVDPVKQTKKSATVSDYEKTA